MEHIEMVGGKKCPTLKLELSGAGCPKSRETEAILDTGFDSFLAIPIDQAYQFGFTLRGEQSMILGDGQIQRLLVAEGTASFAGHKQAVPILLTPQSTCALIGMKFLRSFGARLVIRGKQVTAMNEDEFEELWSVSTKASGNEAPDMTNTESGQVRLPTLTIRLAGFVSPQPTKVEAFIDTGFSGCVSMPVDQALQFGFALHDLQEGELANGKTHWSYAAAGEVTFRRQEEWLPIVLSPPGTTVLVGSAFLERFNVSLIARGDEIKLIDTENTADLSVRGPIDRSGQVVGASTG